MTNLLQHVSDIADRPPQAMAQFARTNPHVTEEREVKHHQAGNHQIADVAVMERQAVRGRHDVLFIGDRQQSPARRLHFGPCDQMGAPVEHDFGAATTIARDSGRQLPRVHRIDQI